MNSMLIGSEGRSAYSYPLESEGAQKMYLKGYNRSNQLYQRYFFLGSILVQILSIPDYTACRSNLYPRCCASLRLVHVA